VLGNMAGGKASSRGHWIAIFVIREGSQLNWFVMDSANADRITVKGKLNAVDFVKNILSP